MSVDINLVVTAENAEGKSYYATAGPAQKDTASMMPGYAFFRLWGFDGVPQLPSDGTVPDFTTYFPGAEGVRVHAAVFPPDSITREPPADPAAGVAELESKLPGLLSHYDPDGSGFHQTPTIDFGIVIDGVLHLELDDGAEVRLTRGSCVVQNGTRHAWHNRSSAPATIIYVFVGAQRA